MPTEQWMMTTNPPRKQLARVIFDKGGAVIVQIGNYDLSYVLYARRHTSPAQAAQDILQWLASAWSTSEEENDPAALVEPSSEDLRSGRYLVTKIDEWDPELEAVARDLKGTGWPNAVEFASRLLSEV
jgi:hypothetical protein